MKLWLDRREKKPGLDIRRFRPRDWGMGTERLSEEIDEVLY